MIDLPSISAGFGTFLNVQSVAEVSQGRSLHLSR